jgi:hypothetical protein
MGRYEMTLEQISLINLEAIEQKEFDKLQSLAVKKPCLQNAFSMFRYRYNNSFRYSRN